MNGEKFNSCRAPQAVGLYPHARKVGNLLFLSGVGPRQVGSKEIPGVKLDEKGKIIEYHNHWNWLCRSCIGNMFC